MEIYQPIKCKGLLTEYTHDYQLLVSPSLCVYSMCIEDYLKMIMETFKSFLIIISVVLSFGVAVVAGQNGLLSARCAARCLTEHKKDLRVVSIDVLN